MWSDAQQHLNLFALDSVVPPPCFDLKFALVTGSRIIGGGSG
jgi:hypothetical protein